MENRRNQGRTDIGGLMKKLLKQTSIFILAVTVSTDLSAQVSSTSVPVAGSANPTSVSASPASVPPVSDGGGGGVVPALPLKAPNGTIFVYPSGSQLYFVSTSCNPGYVVGKNGHGCYPSATKGDFNYKSKLCKDSSFTMSEYQGGIAETCVDAQGYSHTLAIHCPQGYIVGEDGYGCYLAPSVNLIAGSALAGCLNPQYLAPALDKSNSNALVYARGVAGNYFCPIANSLYVQKYRMIPGGSGFQMEPAVNLGGYLIADPVALGSVDSPRFFAIGGGNALYTRTMNEEWSSLGGAIKIMPNRLCDSARTICREPGFNVIAAFGGNYYISTIGGGDQIYIRSLSADWVSLGGTAASAPAFSINNNIAVTGPIINSPGAQIVVDVLGGGGCYRKSADLSTFASPPAWSIVSTAQPEDLASRSGCR